MLSRTSAVVPLLSYYNAPPPSDPPSHRDTDVQLIAVRVLVLRLTSSGLTSNHQPGVTTWMSSGILKFGVTHE